MNWYIFFFNHKSHECANGANGKDIREICKFTRLRMRGVLLPTRRARLPFVIQSLFTKSQGEPFLNCHLQTIVMSPPLPLPPENLHDRIVGDTSRAGLCRAASQFLPPGFVFAHNTTYNAQSLPRKSRRHQPRRGSPNPTYFYGQSACDPARRALVSAI